MYLLNVKMEQARGSAGESVAPGRVSCGMMSRVRVVLYRVLFISKFFTDFIRFTMVRVQSLLLSADLQAELTYPFSEVPARPNPRLFFKLNRLWTEQHCGPNPTVTPE